MVMNMKNWMLSQFFYVKEIKLLEVPSVGTKLKGRYGTTISTAINKELENMVMHTKNFWNGI